KALPRFHDGSESHRNHVMRDLVRAAKKSRIIQVRLPRQRLYARPRSQRGSGLIETDVPVRADTEHLQINPPDGANFVFVLRATLLDVLIHPVGNVDVLLRDIDVSKKILPHEA